MVSLGACITTCLKTNSGKTPTCTCAKKYCENLRNCTCIRKVIPEKFYLDCENIQEDGILENLGFLEFLFVVGGGGVGTLWVEGSHRVFENI